MKKAKNITKQSNSGFTLVELSIVLVIIGLIIGGVMAGRDMIKAATIRAQIAQIQGYATAVNTFQGKYNYLPGDLPPAVVTQFGFTTRTGAAYKGDGNMIINEGCGTASGPGCESALFWRDLSYVGMIDDSFTTATDAQVTAAAGAVGDYLPDAKIKGNFIEATYVSTSAQATVLNNTFLVYGTTSIAAGVRTASNRINPQDAMNIDQKMDDGKPYTGSVLGSWHAAPAAAAAGVCVTSAAGNPYNTATATYANTNSCYMNFKF